MSEENVEIVQRIFEEFQAGLERDDPGAAFDTGLVADDWEWVNATPFEGKSVWRGRQEWVEFMRAWRGEFEDYSVQVDQWIDAGDDRVVVIYRQRATGKGSGVPVEWHGGSVTELRDGRAIRTRNYEHPAEALEAAGLSE
jgi:ketosteroid isomerase-like protein